MFKCAEIDFLNFKRKINKLRLLGDILSDTDPSCIDEELLSPYIRELIYFLNADDKKRALKLFSCLESYETNADDRINAILDEFVTVLNQHFIPTTIDELD